MIFVYTGHRRFAGLTLGWLLTAWVLSTYRSARVCKVFEQMERDAKGMSDAQGNKTPSGKKNKPKAKAATNGKDLGKKDNGANDHDQVITRMVSEYDLEVQQKKKRSKKGDIENQDQQRDRETHENAKWNRIRHYLSLTIDYLLKFPAMSLLGPAW